MLVTLLERVIEVSDEQPLQNPIGMATTPLGIFSEVRLAQF
jgi:hypothetical protein